jgi:acyl-CoA synthetase (AMP-forming)/AMP-acid ligase II
MTLQDQPTSFLRCELGDFSFRSFKSRSKRQHLTDRPSPGLDVTVVDAAGNDVRKGEAGEVLVRSPMMGKGYWKDPEATNTVFRDGWFHTGDLAVQDSGSYLWFRGRAKQIIVRGGSNISSHEVEEVLRHRAHRAARRRLDGDQLPAHDRLSGEAGAWFAYRCLSETAAGAFVD